MNMPPGLPVRASPWKKLPRPSRYWAPGRTGQCQTVGVGRDLRHLQALRNCSGNRRAADPAPGSRRRSERWGKLSKGGGAAKLSHVETISWAQAGAGIWIGGANCTVKIRSSLAYLRSLAAERQTRTVYQKETQREHEENTSRTLQQGTHKRRGDPKQGTNNTHNIRR